MITTVRIPAGMDIVAHAPHTSENEYHKAAREFGDVFNEVKEHLTKEELLCVSMFKNAKKPRQNQVYRVFFEFHHGIKLSTSAITHRKKRVLKVLQHVGALLRFKRDNNIDNFLKDILTNKQYRVLVLYEKRKTLLDISHQLNIKPNTVSQVFSRMLHRLEQESHPLICRYRELLGIVLRYSYKRKI